MKNNKTKSFKMLGKARSEKLALKYVVQKRTLNTTRTSRYITFCVKQTTISYDDGILDDDTINKILDQISEIGTVIRKNNSAIISHESTNEIISIIARG